MSLDSFNPPVQKLCTYTAWKHFTYAYLFRQFILLPSFRLWFKKLSYKYLSAVVTSICSVLGFVIKRMKAKKVSKNVNWCS